MKTIQIYTFAELSEDAKETAMNQYRKKTENYHYGFYYDEIIESAKACAEVFGFEFGREYTDVRTSKIDDCILNLSGVRLYKYIVSNFYNDLFKPRYIKSLDRELICKQFIWKIKKRYNGSYYTTLYSKMRVDNCCSLTGVCYDDDILKPVYEFLTRPDKNTTFEDLLSDIEHAIQKTFDRTEEWLNSDEFINEELENRDFDFLEDGSIL
jgi:hypothetical protein